MKKRKSDKSNFELVQGPIVYSIGLCKVHISTTVRNLDLVEKDKKSDGLDGATDEITLHHMICG